MKRNAPPFPPDGEHGAIAIIAAVTMSVVFGAAALALDLGSLYSARRNLQAATDSAALAATYGLNTAPLATTTAFATNYLSYNGFAASKLSGTPVVTTGRYCPSAATVPPTPNARFVATTSSTAYCPGDTTGATYGLGPNAVQVSAQIQAPLFFGRVALPGTTQRPISATATASQINEAGFEAGTGVANLNMGLVNAVLTPLLGTQVALNAIGYQGLLQTNVTALDFLNALATQLNVTTGTYGSLLQSTVTVQNVLSAAASALATEGVVATGTADPAGGLAALQAAISGSPTIQLSQLLDLGVWQNEAINGTNVATALNAGINLYQLGTLTALIATGANAIAIPTSTLGIPGIATVTVANSVIEPPQSPPFAFGPVGVTVHTAQVRLQLTLSLLGALSALGTSMQVPLYIEAGSGNAKLTAVSCGLSPATDATATISAQSGLVNAYVGQISASTPMTNFSQNVSVSPATLATVGVSVFGLGLLSVQVSGSASALLAAGTSTSLTFTQAQITAGTAQTVSSTGMVSNLLQTLDTSLLSNLTLTATLLGIPATLPVANQSALTTTVSTLLTPVFGGLDTLVDNVLAAMGVKLGYMDVTATGVRCGVPALVL